MKKYIVSLSVISILELFLVVIMFFGVIGAMPEDDFTRSVAIFVWLCAEICMGIITSCNLTSFITSWVNKKWKFTIGRIIYVIVNVGIIAFKVYILPPIMFMFMVA